MESNVVVAAIQLVLTITAASIAVIPPLLKMRSDKNKAEAEATKELTGAALEMVRAWEVRVQALEKKLADQRQSYDTRIAALSQRINVLEEDAEYWKRGCYRLLRQLGEKDIAPCWDPNGTQPTQSQEDLNEQ